MIENSLLIEHSYIKSKSVVLPTEVTYADDGDHITEDEEIKNRYCNNVKDILLEDKQFQ